MISAEDFCDAAVFCEKKIRRRPFSTLASRAQIYLPFTPNALYYAGEL